MLEVKPIQIKTEQERLCALCSIEYQPDALAYSAYEGEHFVGITQFSIKGSAGYIYNVATSPDIKDVEAKFIMGRAAMNFIDLCGIHDVYCDDGDEKVGVMLGFKKDGAGRYYMDMTGFFNAPCKHSENGGCVEK